MNTQRIIDELDRIYDAKNNIQSTKPMKPHISERHIPFTDLTPVQQRMHAILADNVKYYVSDPSRRAVIISDNGKQCLYRTLKGRKCAVGRYIADEHYDPEIEGERIYDSRVEGCLRASLDPIAQQIPISFWAYLQRWHDDGHFTCHNQLTRQLSVILLRYIKSYILSYGS